MDVPVEQAAIAPPGHGAPTRRKKVRKGTRSCWECKRRKIRCIFASAGADTCIGCQRRRAPCVSQDLPEDLAPAKIGNRHLRERLARVEDVVRDLIIVSGNRIGAASQLPGGPGHDGPLPPPQLGPTNTRSNDPSHPPIPAPLAFEEGHGESTPSSVHFTPDSQTSSDQPDFEARALHHLFAALPSGDDVKILLDASSRPALYTYLVNTQPHSKLTREALAVPYRLTGLSDPNIGPVSLARIMLIFAITLQSPCGEKVLGLSEPAGVLMGRLVAAATTWVTTKGEMHESIECLVCIILEGVFQTNSGNLRRAWAVYRRAMAVAQLMGLHRTPLPQLKRIDSELSSNPEFLWFRIVYMDRYLSLLLGLPQGTTDKNIGLTSTLQFEPPLGRFERQLMAISCRVLIRNEGVFNAADIASTQSIDSELLGVSKSMPASFWRPANSLQLIPGSPEALLETVRLSAQVYYYGLLIQAHLPYMMHEIDVNTDQGYSLNTCVNASREIMTRFISHRAFNPMSSCSRPVDFFALLAAMTLLLAHLDVHQRRGAPSFLAHQRLSDRAMLDQALERMDVMSNVNGDATTEQSARLIRQILNIEADAAEGRSYTASSLRDDEESGQEGIGKNNEQVRLQIPYLGIIKIARQGPIARESPAENSVDRKDQDDYVVSSQRHASSIALNSALPPPSIQSPTNEQQTPSQMMSEDSIFSDAQSQQPMCHKQSVLQYSHPLQDYYTFQPNAELHSIAGGIDDWALQGVDMAFFDALMRGTPCMDNAEPG